MSGSCLSPEQTTKGQVLDPTQVGQGALKSLPESRHGESMEGPVLMSETPRQASPHAWMSELCVSGRFRVTLSSRQIWLGFGKG